MVSRYLAIVIMVPSLFLTACETAPDRQKEQTGSVVGAVIGGVLGSQFGQGSGRTAATIVGAVAGGALGNAIGRDMDQTDRIRAAQALEVSRTGEPVSWRNPDTGHEYTVVPTRTYRTAEGPCREYTVNTVIGGRPEKVYGTACRQPDGSWQARN